MAEMIHLIGAPLDLGQSRRGVDMGPSAIRYAGISERLKLLGHSISDIGNVEVPVREHLPAREAPGYASEIYDVCTALYECGLKSVQQNAIPLFLGGDHSIAIGTVAAVSEITSTGVIWIDAHGDFNIPQTSPNGNIHGMPVSILLGYGLEKLINVGRKGAKLLSQNIVLLGTRDLDYDERTMLRSSGIRIFSMREIDERGIASVIRDAIKYLSHVTNIHISLDMDALDPMVAPGVGTPSTGGLSYREAHLMMQILNDCGKIRSADVVEINPILDNKNITAEIAVELMASLFGEKIL